MDESDWQRRVDWIRGDSLGLDIPAHSEALRVGGPEFLTRAFRATLWS